eukprot:9263582-Ditylum_brightwellii.AAC.1
MDKEGFNASSSMLKEFIKTSVRYKECKPKVMEKTSAAHKSHFERGGKCKAERKTGKKAYHEWGQNSLQCHSNGRRCHYCKYHGYCNQTMDECRITINWHKGSTCPKREDRSHKSKKMCFSSGRA